MRRVLFIEGKTSTVMALMAYKSTDVSRLGSVYQGSLTLAFERLLPKAVKACQ